jgi:20S proteasome alpha/beta subunit
MTCIAWDGKTLAADKRQSRGTLITTTSKIFRVGDALIGLSGESALNAQMLAWFRDGEKVDAFPAAQRDKEDWSAIIVVRADGTLHTYERSPYPSVIEDRRFAIGCGRDFALMAMHLGKSAREAVELTAMFDSGCGNGVDVLTLETAKVP